VSIPFAQRALDPENLAHKVPLHLTKYP
jgi:hypothetical protein